MEYEDKVEGRNAVLELLESGRDINKIYISKGERHGSINKIIAIAKERKIGEYFGKINYFAEIKKIINEFCSIRRTWGEN